MIVVCCAMSNSCYLRVVVRGLLFVLFVVSFGVVRRRLSLLCVA